MDTLQNDFIRIEVNTLGAELYSLFNLKTGEEMLWQGDPAYWKRRSPVLFPIVGSVWENKFLYNGKQYEMSQHGFARDMEFSLTEKSDSRVTYELHSSEATKELYPADFVLKISYELIGNSVKVTWQVVNNGEQDMHFQIGAHPAFNYKGFNPDAPVLGLWSPARDSYAPFVCIEPWYCRCDKVGYKGEFAQRDWALHLRPHESFKTSYSIELL